MLHHSSQSSESLTRFVTGLDLGQTQDFSALVIAEVAKIPDPDREGQTLHRFDVRHAHRWQLGTAYPTVVGDVKEMFAKPPLAGSTLAVDATGVGKAVVDMFRQGGIGTQDFRALTITAGQQPGAGTVPKKDLVGAVQAALQGRRLRFAEALPLAPIIEKELENFRAKVTDDRNETFAAWRERDHDDLVLALALALYVGSLSTGGWAVSSSPVRPPSPTRLL
ncbi:MAG: hypothetical protein K8U57_00025 [Planctomycetes bacterium]|nr:hypothetical protein [Planctomycetota bacterium]